MNDAPTGGLELSARARRRRVRGRIAAGATAATMAGLVGGLLWLGTPTPLVTVMSSSMEPELGVGEIALLQSLRGREPEVGDIVEVPVPVDIQRERGYPKKVVHRIVEIDEGMVTTKGDNLNEPDPFEVPIASIDRRMVTVVPGLGRVVAFLVSPFGIIWLGSGAVLFIAGPLVEKYRNRREVAEQRTADKLEHVVAAVADYGYHLKSHTEILKAMSRAAQDLSSVVTRLEGNLDGEPLELLPGRPRPARTRPLVAATRQPATRVVVRAERPLRRPAARPLPPPLRPRTASMRRTATAAAARPVRRRPLVAPTRTTARRPVRRRPLTAR